MNNPEMIGLVGGICGSVIGILGGLVGTYFSIKRTNGPEEKRFMIKAAIVCWIAIFIFLALLFLLPSAYRWYLWIPYAILLPLGIHYLNKNQQKIKEVEEKDSA